MFVEPVAIGEGGVYLLGGGCKEYTLGLYPRNILGQWLVGGVSRRRFRALESPPTSILPNLLRRYKNSVVNRVEHHVRLRFYSSGSRK